MTAISPDTETSATSTAATGPGSGGSTSKPTVQRMISLDVFRGLTIAAMILVNNPGTWKSIYGPASIDGVAR